MTRYNVDETLTRGVEASASLPLLDALTLDLGYAYVFRGGPADDTLLASAPRHSGIVRLAWVADRYQAAATWVLNGDETDVSGARLGGWTRLDLSGSVRLTPEVEAYRRAEKVRDRDYQQVSGFATAGRSAYLGLRARFCGLPPPWGSGVARRPLPEAAHDRVAHAPDLPALDAGPAPPPPRRSARMRGSWRRRGAAGACQACTR